ADLKVYSTLAEYEEATGNKIEKFNEAPMLRTLVAAGELPPVEQRISEEPLVVELDEGPAQYGGILRSPARGVQHGEDMNFTRAQCLLAPSRDDFDTVVPEITKDWDFSEDMKTLTIYLRKGMRWSDGAPVTVDDIMFWHEDVLWNEKLTPAVPKSWTSGGEPIKMEEIDEYTIRLRFSEPYPGIIPLLACYGVYDDLILPKHYLEKYHIKYNPKANEIAKEEGYDSWYQCFLFHKTSSIDIGDPNKPSVFPWVLKEITPAGDKIYVR
ncbi:unnamed protein product, partial [marine sediment metagenome]